MTGVLALEVGQALVAELGDSCNVAARAARLLVASQSLYLEEQDFRRFGIGSAENGRLLRALRVFVDRDWCEDQAGSWRATARIPPRLPAFLDGAAAMRAVLGPSVRASAIITMPGSGSRLRAALPNTGLAYAALEDTSEAFLDMANRARTSFSVMTPFLNAAGLRWAEDLFEATSAPVKELVVRSSAEVMALLSKSPSRLHASSVSVLDYCLRLPDGHYETFHAKVVLADDRIAYVGSANLLAYERRSAELGLVVEGQAVQSVAAFLQAVRSIAKPIVLRP